ncbi:acetyltransferase/esterase [Cadophora sp. DSE1049]|nr:acetyltransferase/esterase [Cadophora sp. DSE1049]
MAHLEVPGASLYYETVGSGPLLLCISGANGSADLWRMMAESLKSSFTVAMYDRRGFSRSYLSGSQAYENRLETDADDAARLIKHLSDEPATVIGNSSGAIVSLELLTRHPSVVRTLIPHEPPVIKLLPDNEELWQIQQDIYDTYRGSGVEPALMKFVDIAKAGPEAPGLLASFDPRNGPFISSNVMYWFERELLVYPFREFNITALYSHKDLLLLANGRDSNPEALQYRANVVLGEKLGLRVSLFPGMHIGFASHPQEFAKTLIECLKEKHDFYGKI